jgi:hypothetical protein
MFVRYDDKDFADINELKRMYFLERQIEFQVYTVLFKSEMSSPL